MYRRKGFSLIELLIVVAIIGILAAIAVPNFLEAQTRSKVSRMRADMRTLATGLESYIVDKGTYPVSAYRNNVDADTWFGYSALTTPVSYLSKIPKDIFSQSTGETGYGSGRRCPPQLYTGTLELNLTAPTLEDAVSGMLDARNFWVLVSYGPDSTFSTVNSETAYPAIGVTGNYSGASGEISGETDPGHSTGAFFFAKSNSDFGGWDGVPYDSTNGSISDGDLYHWRANFRLEQFSR
ncbi:MAG: type II secretion system protein [Candidatus Sumerlaeota bacterium]